MAKPGSLLIELKAACTFLIGNAMAKTDSKHGSVLNGFVILITLFLFQPSLATARQIDVIVNLYVDEAGKTTDVFEDERAVTALVSAVDWQLLTSRAQLGPLDSLSLFVKGRQIALEPDSHDSNGARRLMRAVGLAEGYDYSLDADRFDEEGFETRQIIAEMMERYLAIIGLRRNELGNPINEVEIFIREASMRADLVVTIDLAEYDAVQDELVILATVSNPGRDLAPSTITAAIDAQTGRVFATEELSRLGSGDSIETRIALPVPDDWRGTRRQIEVRVDFENAIPEVNEENNVALSDPIPITDLLGPDPAVIEPALPDLTIRHVLPVWDADSEQLNVLVEIENGGGPAADETRVSLTSIGGLFEPKFDSIVALATGSVTDLTLKIAPDPGQDTLDVVIIVDPDNLIDEQDEGNNQYRFQFEVPAQQLPRWFILVIALVAVSLVAVITVVIQKLRGSRSSGPEVEPSSTPDAPDLTTRVQADPGQQRFGCETSGISLPGLNIRPNLDEGTQKIEFTQAKPEEE